MTNPSHRAEPAVLSPAVTSPGAPLAGTTRRQAAPRGMWAVAWRQHRVQVLVLVGVMAAAIGAMVAFRQLAAARLAAYGCALDTTGCMDANAGGYLDVWRDDMQSAWYAPATWWEIMHIALIGAPIVLGAFAGAVIFPREFARGTQVFALTQGVTQRKWWAAKIAVLGIPLIAGLLAMGFATTWVDGTFAYTSGGVLRPQTFLAQGPMPAAMGLAIFALAVTIGIVIRNLMAALVTALALALALTAGALIAYPYLITPVRETTPISEAFLGGPTSYSQSDENTLHLDSGYLDTNGREVDQSPAARACSPDYNAARQQAAAELGIDMETFEGEIPQAVFTAGDRALADCLAGRGVTAQYVDYQPGSRLWPLRAWLIAYCVILAAAALALGAWRLPKSVAKR